MKDNTNPPKRAVIYCRVSSRKQANEGTGLESQEHRCRDYAAARGYIVEAVFPDDISGGGDFMKRPGMVALLAYLDANPFENYVVIFDDLKRYARDTEFHLKLRRIMGERGATRECLNFNFEDSPEGKFIETMLAAQGELEREQNGRQVVQKMRARLEQGFWCFQSPPGFKYAKSKFGGKELVRDEPVASILQEALEGFASGRFRSQGEIKRFLDQHAEFPKGGNGEVHLSRVYEFLTRVIYTGYIEVPNWNMPRRKGRHEGIISYQTFLRNQEILTTGAKAPHRADLSEDFPLRGFVCCDDCNRPLTAAWSKGRKQRHPYYLCHTKGCDSYGKSIRRADMEGAFEQLLRDLQPQQSFVELCKTMIKDAWKQRATQAVTWKKSLEREIADIEKQMETFLDRIVESNSPATISAFERKVEKLEQEKLIAAEKLVKGMAPRTTIDKLIEPVLQVVANPCKLWDSGNLKLRRLAMKLVFADQLSYSRKTGYRTAKTTIIFKMLDNVSDLKSGMVPPHGLEPRTY